MKLIQLRKIPKNKSINLRLTEEEFGCLKAAAEVCSAGNVSLLIRHCILDFANRVAREIQKHPKEVPTGVLVDGGARVRAE